MLDIIKNDIIKSLSTLTKKYGPLETASYWDAEDGERFYIRPQRSASVKEGAHSWVMIFNNLDLHVSSTLNDVAIDIFTAELYEGRYWPVSWVTSDDAREELQKSKEVAEAFALKFKFKPKGMEVLN